jgi:hypothetical protein
MEFSISNFHWQKKEENKSPCPSVVAKGTNGIGLHFPIEYQGCTSGFFLFVSTISNITFYVRKGLEILSQIVQQKWWR